MGTFGRRAPRFDPSNLTGSDRTMLLGATLRDVGNALRGGDSDAVLQAQGLIAQREQLARQEAFAKRFAGLFGAQRAAMGSGPVVNGGGEDISAAFGSGGAQSAEHPPTMQDALPLLLEGALSGDPRVGDLAALVRQSQPDKTQFMEGPDGIYERTPQGWTLSKSYPKAPAAIPAGMVEGPDGKLSWRPGYVEAQGQLSGTRRDAVVSRPMPRTAGGGRRSAGRAPPSGFILD